ncbi:hypothetical protein P154DRAFT_518546 [Amniculicola lignicola CBS 123094]|uniref:Uncharacterized protein n=1 Tax=Amniculicola lignicola CBS 123094 TaxID=1392246 RepID=A0A6A5X2G6_9PLEO|nr:hypothetical protein P154DRAFT_518546 [Amniculicola lignicola CBS 123094]
MPLNHDSDDAFPIFWPRSRPKATPSPFPPPNCDAASHLFVDCSDQASCPPKMQET